MNYIFEWDTHKALSNLKKHKISFEQASEIFLDRFALSIYDEEHSQDEDRWVTLGHIKSEKLLVVVHTFVEIYNDQTLIRIISARRASKQERNIYQERKP